MDFYRGTGASPPEGEREIRTRILSEETFKAQFAPERYRLVFPGSKDQGAGLAAVRAVNTALALRMPLLVSGEPGSGKTQLGYAIAHELGKPQPFRFVTKSTSVARDLFYDYDAVRHFQTAQARMRPEDVDVRDFIEYAPLGLAILLALPLKDRQLFISDKVMAGGEEEGATDERQRIRQLLRSEQRRQCVVVIDEIDKAPRDFPNDLLVEIENPSFRIPELGGIETQAVDAAFRPIVVITTNSERQLPDAFLRRCAFLHLDYAKGDGLVAILEARVGGLFETASPFLRDVRAFYESIRERKVEEKPPGIAELLQFLQAAAEMGVDQRKTIAAQRDLVAGAVPLLGKTVKDQASIRAAIAAWVSKATP